MKNGNIAVVPARDLAAGSAGQRLRSLAAIAIVTAAIFVKAFPFSGHLLGVALVVLLARWWFPHSSSPWFRRKSTLSVIVRALAVAGVVMAIDYLMLKNSSHSPDFSRFHLLRGNLRLTAAWIVLVWVVVAPSEELIDRAFLIDRWLGVFHGVAWAPIAAVALSSIGFGLVHFYEGRVGVATNTAAAICFGTLYLAEKRSLWSNIIAHAVVDTVAMAAFCLGWL